MKRVILISSIVAIFVTSCSGLAFSRNTELSDKYGDVTVFTAPT